MSEYNRRGDVDYLSSPNDGVLIYALFVMGCVYLRIVMGVRRLGSHIFVVCLSLELHKLDSEYKVQLRKECVPVPGIARPAQRLSESGSSSTCIYRNVICGYRQLKRRASNDADVNPRPQVHATPSTLSGTSTNGWSCCDCIKNNDELYRLSFHKRLISYDRPLLQSSAIPR